MSLRTLAALLALLLLPAAASAGKPKTVTYSALVDASGSVAFSHGEFFVQKSIVEPVGVYQVSIIGRSDLNGCVAVASSAGGFLGTVGTEQSVLPHIIFVVTSVGGGAALLDMPFYIILHCPKL